MDETALDRTSFVGTERDLSDLKTVFDPNTLTKKGLCPVSDMKSGSPIESHSLYYEIHGNGPEKIVLMMGLNASSFGWINQVNHFGADKRYSVLVFDNRGVGNSDAPKGPYSTSAMAEDIVVLLDFIGWKSPRGVHVVGISMGGMIAQELAYCIPERIASLSMISTTPGYWIRPFWNTSPFMGTYLLVKTTLMSNMEDRIPFVLQMLYPTAYLAEKIPDDPAGRTYRDKQTEGYKHRIAHTRPQQLVGALSQMYAALCHYVSPARLSTIAHNIPKILVLTGDDDVLVAPKNSDRLAAGLRSGKSKTDIDVEFIKWEKTGHGVMAQWPDRTNALLERVFDEGRAKSVA